MTPTDLKEYVKKHNIKLKDVPWNQALAVVLRVDYENRVLMRGGRP